ncbi:hypothetical protein JAAARDRAFT_490223 [Jaapia argillacea MUCL 33604]|uniref:Uncharacterized protein n=1 Tax=Jaapia argillacea MUCL 33604 TaxID=933084 RepID=A0A067PB18_9AGAM|nr:hypothetical protein JAAARDRAFT_490223 [Jaapia argillacea MUCL 33604]
MTTLASQAVSHPHPIQATLLSIEAKHAYEKVSDSPHASSCRTRVSMTSLTHVDEIFALCPPTHPSLCISEIVGLQVMRSRWKRRLSPRKRPPGEVSIVFDYGLPRLT